MLIQQLSTSHQVSIDRFYRTLYESLLDPRLITSSKQSLYLNLLFKSLKSDLNVNRVKAFVKRLVQIMSLHSPSFICGVLYLIRELEGTFATLKSLFDEPEEMEGEGEEVFRDIPDEDDPTTANAPAGGDQTSSRSLSNYDPRKRDPEHSNAEKSCLWEILPLLRHFHPAVSISAERLLEHKPIPGKPDLSLNTLIHFLDKFVYRNAKANTTSLRGSSIMQPLSGGDASGLLVPGRHATSAKSSVNTEAFWRLKAEDVAAEDAFFHDYFHRVGKDKMASRKKNREDAGKGPLEEDEEDEEEVWKALVDSRPEVEGDEDEVGFDEDDLDDMDSDELDDEDGEGVDVESDEDEEMAEAEGDAGVDEELEAMSGLDELEDDDDEISASEVEEEPAVVDAAKEARDAKKNKRRKLKGMPTFASADDYAAMLDDDVDEDLG